MKPSSLCSQCWPAMLTFELACRYLSLESARFQALAERHHVYPVEVDDVCALWRRSDLNRLVGRLPIVRSVQGDPAQPKLIALDAATVHQLATLIAARLDQSGDSPELLSVKEAGRRLGLSRSTVYKMIDQGTLVVRRIGGRTLITRDSISSVIELSPD